MTLGAAGAHEGDVLLVAGWEIEPSAHEMSRGRERRRLEPRVMEVLLRLAASPGRVVSRANLLGDVWGDAFVGDDALTAAVIKLRKAFGDDARSSRVIETVAKSGYRLIADVSLHSDLGVPASVDAERVALPLRLHRRPAVGLVGREVELATISDAFKRIAEGEGCAVLLVSGEAGVGKSTLVAEGARSAFDSGACVLLGGFDEEVSMPYRLFTEALGPLVPDVHDEHVAGDTSSPRTHLLRLMPAVATRTVGLGAAEFADAESERYQLFEAVVGLLSRVEQLDPVVLVVEDLQWADEASLQLLRHVITAGQLRRLLVLGTYRDGELSGARPLLDALAELHRRQLGIKTVELAGLEDTGVIALMEAAAGHTLDAVSIGLARAVHRETDGNPFYVTEVLRHLSETGTIRHDVNGQWVATDTGGNVSLPDSVRLVVAARVARLGPSAGRVLSTAAVIGRNFDVDVLARAAGTPEDDIVDVLDAASRAALVFELADEPGQYGFSHALVQHMLYDDLGLSRRARTHLKVAEAIEGLSGTRSDSRNGELARHWANAPQPANLAKAVEASRRAADAALSALAPADALRHYSHAVDLLARSAEPDPLLAIDLNVGLGTAQRQTGDPAYRATLLGASRQAADRADAGRLASAALAYSQANLFSDGAKFDVERVQTLELALDHLSSHDPRRARLLATLCTELTYVSPLSRRQALADEAVAVAEAAGDDATIVWVLNHVLYSLRVPQLFARSLASSADALTRAERIDDPVLVFWSAQLRAGVAACAGDIVEMDRCLAIVALLAERLAQPTLTWIHLFVSAERAQIAGDGELTAQLARAARQVGRDIYEPEADLFYSSQIGAVSFQQGRFGRLIPVLEETSSDVPLMAEVIASLLALAHVEAGQLDEAGRLLARFAATGFELPLAPTWLTVMVHYAEVAFVCRDRRNGAPLLDRLAPFGEQVSNGGLKSEGPVIHYLGGLATVLGSFDRADIYFAQAAAMNERMKAKFFAARTNLWWGQMLAERNGSGDAERARALLAEARVCAATNGYVNVERRAASALDQMV